MLEKLKKLFKTKNEFLIVAILAVAIILLFSSTLFDFKKESESTDTERYVEYLENKLEKSISKIDGVKNVSVIIKVDSAIQTVIAEDQKKIEENGKVTTTTSTVLVGGKPIILGEIYPSISGVIVVCDCKNSLTVKMSVLDIVTTALDISCEKVRVLTQ